MPLLLGATIIGDGANDKANVTSGTAHNVAVFVTDLTGLRQTESALRGKRETGGSGQAGWVDRPRNQ